MQTLLLGSLVWVMTVFSAVPAAAATFRVLGQTGSCFGADFTTATRSSTTEFRARLP